MPKTPRQSSLRKTSSQANLSINRPLSASAFVSLRFSLKPPPLSVAAITDSAQHFAATSSFYLALFLSVRFDQQQFVQISRKFLEQVAASSSSSATL